jgi:sigma-B regulation protein RsbU (phosphoserine phosphatase)
MQADDATHHLDLIAAMTGDFAESQDIDATLHLGLGRIAEALGAEAASLFLRASEDPGTLVCRTARGPVEVTGLSIAVAEGIVGRAVSTQQPQIVRDARQDPDFLTDVDALTGFVTKSILCAPITVRGETLGAIELINRRDGELFTTADCRLLETLASAAGLAVVNARMAGALADRARLKREIELAADMQRAFLPQPRAHGFPVHGATRPAYEAAGDFYDIVERGDGATWFAIADVAGKGMNAAFVMAETASLFRYLARHADDPWAVLRAINTELYANRRGGLFVTMTCGVLAPDRASVRLANAGHMPTLLLGGDGAGRAVRMPAEAPPLGVLAELEGAPAAAEALPLEGRALYLFSDGLSELPGDKVEEIGIDGVEDAIRAVKSAEGDGGPEAGGPPGARLEKIFDRIAGAQATVSDDLTLLVVEPSA